MEDEGSTPEEHPEIMEVIEGELVRSRAQEAYELKLRGDTLASIADQLGYSDTSEVVRAINTQMKTDAEFLSTAGRNGLLQMELDRLDRLQAKLWPSAMQADLQSVDRVLKIMDRRAKLAGLDSIDTSSQQHTVLVIGGAEADYVQKLKELS